MSTRRIEVQGQTLCFDHGAQYFTVRDVAFARQVAEWGRAGTAARWPAAGSDAWVGTPGMNAPVKWMAAHHAISWDTKIEALERRAEAWHLVGAPIPTSFDAVLIAVPAEQAVPLLRPFQRSFSDKAARVRSSPCLTAMIAFADPVWTDSTIVRKAGVIAWAARDGSKPSRGNNETWVVQASPEWSIEHLELPSEQVAAKLLLLLQAALARPLPQPVHLSAHRWRYARRGHDGPGALWDPATKLGACGDWLLAPRVEAAWLSGQSLAAMIGNA